ncbi:TPA: hypothetical protein ACH3X2_009583 [Trebouxia sp. C0005]
MGYDRRAVNTGRVADMNDIVSLLPQKVGPDCKMKKPVTTAEPQSPQIKVGERMGETEFAIESDASRSTIRTPQGKRFHDPAFLVPLANKERPKEGQGEVTPVAHMPHESTSILSTDHVTYDSLSQLLQGHLSEHSIMNRLSFMPLLPEPCASRQEANVRMAYNSKVPPTMPTPATSNTDPSQLCSCDTSLKFGSFDAAYFSSAFSCAASAMHHPVPATDSSQQFQEWQAVCRNNQRRHPDPYMLFPMDVYNRDSFWPYPG